MSESSWLRKIYDDGEANGAAMSTGHDLAPSEAFRLSLCENPPPFTWEDYDMVMTTAEEYATELVPLKNRAMSLALLAGRIAALLPPRTS